MDTISKIELDYRNILEYTKDVQEYLFVDQVTVEGSKAIGKKLVSSQDWYFCIHFPGNPIMPGVFIMESIMQTGTFIVSTMPGKKDISLLFDSSEKTKFYRGVRPGDILDTSAELLSYKRGIIKFVGEAYVDEELVCKMSFTLVSPDELIKNNMKK